MTKGLKRCPFCNQDASVLTEREDYRVVCGYCAASTGCFETAKEAVAAWNNRPIEDEKDKENKRLREALEKIIDRAEIEESKASNATYGFAYDIEDIARDALKGVKK